MRLGDRLPIGEGYFLHGLLAGHPGIDGRPDLADGIIDIERPERNQTSAFSSDGVSNMVSQKQGQTGAAALDPMDVAVLQHKILYTSDLMGNVLKYSGQCFILMECNDFSPGVYDEHGRLLSVKTWMPLHVAVAKEQVSPLVKRFKGNIFPGDVFLANDPYQASGSHLPDWSIIRPVFHDDELMFFTLLKGHQQDTGGAFPGGYYPGAYDLHSEGLRIDYVKIFERGERQPVYDFILNNVRWPEIVAMDNMAMIGATKRAEDELVRLCQKMTNQKVRACIQGLLDSSEQAMRAEISKMPDGTYYGEHACDWDGTTDRPVWVRTNITIRGDEMVVDWSESDKQVDFINTPTAVTNACTLIPILMSVNPDITFNAGSCNPIQIIAPEGTVVNPKYPANIGACNNHLGNELIAAVQMALGKAMPQEVSAMWANHVSFVTFGEDAREVDPESGMYKTFFFTVFGPGGGSGAIWGYDGWPHVAPTIMAGGLMKNTVEITEIMTPWRIQQYGFYQDSAGAGQWRGGVGTHYSMANDNGGRTYVNTGTCSGQKFRPFGQAEGKEAIYHDLYFERDGERIPFRTMSQVQYQNGDSLVGKTSGGGGVGNPSARPVELVQDDVLTEFVSIEAAREDYGVVIDPESLQVDLEATQKLRSSK
jgi:N-methylhydantoinase B